MKEKKRFIYLVGAIFVTFFIFSNSMQSADSSSEISRGLFSVIKDFLFAFGISLDWLTHSVIRKLAHITEFFIQGFFLCMFFKPKYKFVFIISFLTACTDEILQMFYPGRAGRLIDILIDFSGALWAVLLCILVKIIFSKRRTRWHFRKILE